MIPATRELAGLAGAAEQIVSWVWLSGNLLDITVLPCNDEVQSGYSVLTPIIAQLHPTDPPKHEFSALEDVPCTK